MEVLDQPQPYTYTPQWSTQNALTSLLSPYPTSRAGDLLSSLIPDYSSPNTRYSSPSSSRKVTYSTSVSPAEIPNPLPSMVSTASSRPRGSGYNPRPNVGRSRSYPNSRLGTFFELDNGAFVEVNAGQPAWQSSFPTISSTRMQGNVNVIPMSLVTSHPISPTPMGNPLMLNGMGQASVASHAISSSLSSSRMKVNVNGSSPPAVTGPMSPARNMAVMSGVPLLDGGPMRMDATAMPVQPEAPNYELPHRAVEKQSPQSWEIPIRFVRDLYFVFCHHYSKDCLISCLYQKLSDTNDLPLQVAPTGPVDSILISLLQRQRTLSLEETTGVALTGPKSPSLRVLVNPEHSNAVHPVASILSSLLQRLSLKSLAEKVAVLLVTYHLIQWQISPSKETYNNIPEWFVPRASQLFTEHPLWISLVR